MGLRSRLFGMVAKCLEKWMHLESFDCFLPVSVANCQETSQFFHNVLCASQSHLRDGPIYRSDVTFYVPLNRSYKLVQFITLTWRIIHFIHYSFILCPCWWMLLCFWLLKDTIKLLQCQPTRQHLIQWPVSSVIMRKTTKSVINVCTSTKLSAEKTILSNRQNAACLFIAKHVPKVELSFHTTCPDRGIVEGEILCDTERETVNSDANWAPIVNHVLWVGWKLAPWNHCWWIKWTIYLWFKMERAFINCVKQFIKAAALSASQWTGNTSGYSCCAGDTAS